MIPENLETLNRSFAVQAPNFDSKSVNFTKKEYLDYTVDAANPAGTDIVLEAADEPLRKTEGEIETLRDPSHVKSLSREDSNPGIVLSQEQIFGAVWNMDSDNCHSSVVNVIYNLREKIEPDSKNHTYIKTVLGVGYKFNG